MNDEKKLFLLIFLVTILFLVNYNLIDGAIEKFLNDDEFVFVERIIDGDTIKANNISIRLLGINSPERGEEYYDEAKEFLKKEISNEIVKLEFGKDKKDRYGRTLAYIFFNRKNINLELVEEGFANYYFPSGKDAYYKKFNDAWLNCLEENKNLCEKSEDICSKCVELKAWDFKNQEIVFYNKCGFSCDLTKWEIKDEGRKKFIFPEFALKSGEEVKVIVGNETNTENALFWKKEDYVWTKTGDSLFLRDSKGKLVLWKSY